MIIVFKLHGKEEKTDREQVIEIIGGMGENLIWL